MGQLEEYEYDYKLEKSPVPYISVGAVWAIWAVALPLYEWYHFLLAAGVSVAVYFVASRIFPAKQIKIRRQHKIELSGDKDTDMLIKEARDCIKDIEKTAVAIDTVTPSLANDARVLVDDGVKILDYISKYPESAKLVRRFLNYYLPTLDKLLNSYIDFKKHGTAAETCAEIEDTVPEMRKVFQGQLEKLMSDRELDISTDIDVLESKLNKM